MQCLKASAQVSSRIQVCPLAHLHRNKAQIVSLRPPHDSNVAHMMTSCCDIPVHIAISSVAPTSGHMCLTQSLTHSNPRNHSNWRVVSCGGGNLQTKLARRCAGVSHLWMGYPCRSSYAAAPRGALAVATSTRPIQCYCRHIGVSSAVVAEGATAARAVGNRAWVPPPTAQVNPGGRRPRDLAALPGHCFPGR